MNRERKRQQLQQQQQQQQQLNHLHQNSPTQSIPPSQPPPPPPPPNHPMNGGADSNINHSPNSNGSQYHNVNNVLLDPTTNEPIYPPSMPAGDSWV